MGNQSGQVKPPAGRDAGDAAAEEKFKEITEAFEVLSDPVKRAEYNSRGYVGRPSQFKQEHRKSTGTSTDRDEAFVHSASHRYKATQAELDAVQCSFFGGSDLAGRNILVHLTVSNAELRTGCVQGVKWKKKVRCNTCDGYGVANPDKSTVLKCKACAGTGNVMQIPGKQGFMYPKCDFCDGTGVLDLFCRDCKGSGLTGMEIEEMMVEIPLGTPSGHQIVIRGRGEPGAKGGLAGNLHVIVLGK
jgi:molecular chaperone DnaJ